MKKRIKKVAVLGSGVMGSRIACHFANVGVEVYLLDLPAKSEKEPNVASLNLKKCLADKPAALYDPKFSSRIQTGTFDDLARIKDCDWIVEAVVEDLAVKQKLFEQVDQHRQVGSLVSSNTSGMPITALAKDRSEDFRKHFCGTHFFNPPRYLRLLEIIPGPETLAEVMDFLTTYARLHLGKEVVICKDTPAFIANRIGVYGLLSTLRAVEKVGLSVGETDSLTGTLIGRPKSATFRTLDVVGIDVLCKVARHLAAVLPKKESQTSFQLPKSLLHLEKIGHLGSKTGQGFFKKTTQSGKRIIEELDLGTMNYVARTKISLPSVESIKEAPLPERIKHLYREEGKVGNFFRRTWQDLFAYSSACIPEISEDLYKIDDAMRAGFGWEMGPFELWETLGVKEVYQHMGKTPWIDRMLKKGLTHFYTTKQGKQYAYDPQKEDYVPIPGQEGMLLLSTQEEKKVWSTEHVTLYDVGDGVFNMAFHTKMNSLGEEVMRGIERSLKTAEDSSAALVLGHEEEHFSAGANLSALLSYAMEQEFDEIDLMIRQFQQIIARIRHSPVPVVVAVSGMCLGGGCELCLHADAIQAHAESYIGLVEMGVGLIPAGGGTKEMALRCGDTLKEGDNSLNRYLKVFENIATAKVSTSAHEAKTLGFLNPNDNITTNKRLLLQHAKKHALKKMEQGYQPPLERKDIWVQGRRGIALMEAGITTMLFGHFISEYDAKIARKLAYVMNGGDLSTPTHVSESYLRDLEREAFLSLCGENKTIERIQHILFKGKPLRN